MSTELQNEMNNVKWCVFSAVGLGYAGLLGTAVRQLQTASVGRLPMLQFVFKFLWTLSSPHVVTVALACR